MSGKVIILGGENQEECVEVSGNSYKHCHVDFKKLDIELWDFVSTETRINNTIMYYKDYSSWEMRLFAVEADFCSKN